MLRTCGEIVQEANREFDEVNSWEDGPDKKKYTRIVRAKLERNLMENPSALAKARAYKFENY